MTRGGVQEYAEALRERYSSATKAEKGAILDEFCRTTGYHRKAAVRLLRGSRPRSSGPPRARRYGPEVRVALEQVRAAAGDICAKRLVPFLPELVPQLERHGELRLDAATRARLLELSAATADRLLARGRRRPVLARRTAAAALRRSVPLRTFGEWTAVAPGALQADLVAHCGESTAGFYLTTLVVVDVATGWTELEALWGHGQERVAGALERIRRRLPFALRELHTDNGSEFLNATVLRWAAEHDVTLSRGRPYRKNDQAWVEQRNWTAVRRVVGYDRYSSRRAHAALRTLYPALSAWLDLRPSRSSRPRSATAPGWCAATTPRGRHTDACSRRASSARPWRPPSSGTSMRSTPWRCARRSSACSSRSGARQSRPVYGNHRREAPGPSSVTVIHEARRTRASQSVAPGGHQVRLRLERHEAAAQRRAALRRDAVEQVAQQ